jgi:hypothetical protein
MTRDQISIAPTQRLNDREAQLLRRASRITASFDEGYDDVWAEIDMIRDELAGREHDLEDPSSGLGLHQPT